MGRLESIDESLKPKQLARSLSSLRIMFLNSTLREGPYLPLTSQLLGVLLYMGF